MRAQASLRGGADGGVFDYALTPDKEAYQVFRNPTHIEGSSQIDATTPLTRLKICPPNAQLMDSGSGSRDRPQRRSRHGEDFGIQEGHRVLLRSLNTSTRSSPTHSRTSSGDRSSTGSTTVSHGDVIYDFHGSPRRQSVVIDSPQYPVRIETWSHGTAGVQGPHSARGGGEIAQSPYASMPPSPRRILSASNSPRVQPHAPSLSQPMPEVPAWVMDHEHNRRLRQRFEIPEASRSHLSPDIPDWARRAEVPLERRQPRSIPMYLAEEPSPTESMHAHSGKEPAHLTPRKEEPGIFTFQDVHASVKEAYGCDDEAASAVLAMYPVSWNKRSYRRHIVEGIVPYAPVILAESAADLRARGRRSCSLSDLPRQLDIPVRLHDDMDPISIERTSRLVYDLDMRRSRSDQGTAAYQRQRSHYPDASTTPWHLRGRQKGEDVIYRCLVPDIIRSRSDQYSPRRTTSWERHRPSPAEFSPDPLEGPRTSFIVDEAGLVTELSREAPAPEDHTYTPEEDQYASLRPFDFDSLEPKTVESLEEAVRQYKIIRVLEISTREAISRRRAQLQLPCETCGTPTACETEADTVMGSLERECRTCFLGRSWTAITARNHDAGNLPGLWVPEARTGSDDSRSTAGGLA